MQTIYIESSVISVITAKPSVDYEKYVNQTVTWKFWDKSKGHFKKFISPPVLEEISRGDVSAVSARLELIKNIEILPLTEESILLAEKYIKVLGLPKKAEVDALHIAMASHYKIDYMLSWNMKHIVNSQNIRKLIDYNVKNKIHNVVITTPKLFMGVADEKN
mgnify:CR=1 FL=1